MYRPRNVPANPADIPAFLREEFDLIARSWSSPEPYLFVAKSFKPPDRPMEGMVVLADGTSWNPGSGAGYYGYRGTSWTFLG